MRIFLFLLALSSAFGAEFKPVPHYLWFEAETFGPLSGGNFSFQQEKQTTKGSWSVGGPGVAPEWTMGGESEWMSIATRADETNGVITSHSAEIPAAGDYVLWVRYMDYRHKEESFGVRVKQVAKQWEHVFGLKPVVDEFDSMLMLWNFSFAWDHASVALQKGPAQIELFTTGPTQARRAVDCLCLTTDKIWKPMGREKPDFATWRVMRAFTIEVPGRVVWTSSGAVPAPWKIAQQAPIFVWNSGEKWLQELARPLEQRMEFPFEVDPPLLTNFLAAFRGKEPAIYSAERSGPALNISRYPNIFSNGSPFTAWLDRHPDKKFCMLLNYSEPDWPKNPDKALVYQNFQKYEKQFSGFIAGESIAHAGTDDTTMQKKVRKATTRGEVLQALRVMHTDSVVKKFSGYFGKALTPEEAWAPIISCLSGNAEAYAHALCSWGVKRLGHENTGNSPTLARRLAFMRGAARQFGAKIFNYQSCNLGDSATMYSRQAFLYPASSKYIWDNSYDAWAGAGHHWLLKDYLLWYLAGVDGYYNEQGVDMYWKMGGNAAGDNFPVELSPKGRTAEAVIELQAKYSRGTQFTPVAILLDEAHGWSQERFHPGSFQLDPELNLKLLKPGKHDAAIRAMFDVAYYPAPETQNEPASGIRQTFVNGIFGDIFDVIVNTEGKSQILSTYRVTFVAGELALSESWADAILDYVRKGGTIVVSADQLSGPGVARLGLPGQGAIKESDSVRWDNKNYASQLFKYYQMKANGWDALAKTSQGDPLALAKKIGKGRLIFITAALCLGSDERPISVLALLMRQLTENIVPLQVHGDVEWILNRLDDGGWLVGLFNNRGVIKPQHGVLPTDERQSIEVELRVPWQVRDSIEWITDKPVAWERDSIAVVQLPPGAVRFVTIYPK